MSESAPPGEPTLPFADESDEQLPPVRIGRYHLLELAGAGGMGMVWAAWDPELERRVAIKLVRSAHPEARSRMLREGQVLARLSHPNIVPIFDVGELGDQVYLVMEWIRGTTLRSFKGDRRAVLAAYRQAGEGLAAAHDAGIVHRDFKPDNAVRGEDGRVRVLDFGIAHESIAPGAGTPRYMAPEQARGDATAASDQFAFCISLREALDDVPSWIEAIVDRGTAPDVAKRFSSMHELLRALARDPARRWRRAAVGVVAIGAAIGAFAIGRTRASSAIEPCSGTPDEIASAWNPHVRDRIAAHLRELGGHASAESAALGVDLDAYAHTWIDEHHHACLAHERAELTPALYETRLRCLTRLRAQLAATSELMSTVDTAGLAPALTTARELPDPRGCIDADGAVPPPPAATAASVAAVVPHVERALVRAAAKRDDAIVLARAATAEARATGYIPLIARALLAEGRAVTVKDVDGRATFAEAMSLALRGSDDTTAVEAYARWIYELARNGDTQIDNWNVMTEIAVRSGNAGRFARALMYNNRAVARITAEDKAGARDLLRQAKSIAGDDPNLELITIDINLASLESDPDTYAKAERAVLSRLDAVLGPSHPDVLIARMALAVVDRDLVSARRDIDEACRGFESWGNMDAAMECAFDAAWIADEAGDRDAAAAWMERVAAHGDELRRPIASAYLAVVHDAKDRDEQLAALEKFAAQKHDTWWERSIAADALAVIAHVDPSSWRRVVDVMDTLDQPYYARRRARAHAQLAIQLATSQPDEARVHAAIALAWYREGPRTAQLTAIATRPATH